MVWIKAEFLPLDVKVLSSADDDGADGGRAGGARIVLVDGPLRPARVAAAAALVAIQQQRPFRAEGALLCWTSANSFIITPQSLVKCYGLRKRHIPKY